MKKIIIFSITLLTIHTIQPAVAPKMPLSVAPKVAVPTTAAQATTTTKAKEYSVVISVAYDINIINTSTTAATLNAITIQYTTSSAPDNMLTITAATQTSIPANKGISFHPKITIKTPEQNISAQFQGITGITINSQKLTFPQAAMGTSPIYIANVNGTWKLTTKPAPKAIVTPKATPTPKAPVAPTPKINSMQATAVPYLKTTHPELPIMPKSPIMNAPKMPMPKMPAAPKMPMMPAPKSMAAKASAKAINQTMAK